MPVTKCDLLLVSMPAGVRRDRDDREIVTCVMRGRQQTWHERWIARNGGTGNGLTSPADRENNPAGWVVLLFSRHLERAPSCGGPMRAKRSSIG
jgi:hypothetical protein